MTPILTGSSQPVLAVAGCGQSPLTRFACNPASPWHVLGHDLARLARQLAGWWPLLAAACILAAAAAVATTFIAAHARTAEARQATWVEVIPPAVLHPDAAEALWRALAGMLARARPRLGRAPRLAAEFTAGPDGVRAGIWVPPGLSADQVAGVVTRCLPGARAQVTADPPALPVGRAGLSASHVSALGGPWAPLTDPARPRPRAGSPDSLHGLLAALAYRAPGETMITQLIVSAARPARRDSGPLWARASLALLQLPFRVLLAVADVFLPGGPARQPGRPALPDNPAVAAHRKAIAGKQARPPHLTVTVRVAVAAPSRRARRHALASVTGGYDLACPAAVLTARPAARPGVLVAERRPGPARCRMTVTVEETAALWHPPSEAVVYGMPVTAARVRPPVRDLPRLPVAGRQPAMAETARHEPYEESDNDPQDDHDDYRYGYGDDAVPPAGEDAGYLSGHDPDAYLPGRWHDPWSDSSAGDDGRGRDRGHDDAA